ncbi:hypothetical protein Tco_1291665 [Tanacetum coccineum]
MDKGKGQISRANNEAFIEVKCKKSGGNNRGNKHLKSVSVKQKTQYGPKAKSSTTRTTPPASTNKASTFGYNKESPSNKENVAKNASASTLPKRPPRPLFTTLNKGNGSFSICNSFEALNVDNSIIEEAAMGSKVTTSGNQWKRLIKSNKSDSDDEVEPVQNETFLELEVVEELLEEEMLVSSSNHWLMVMWMSFGNGSSSGCHGGVWWLIMDEEDDEVVVNIWREFIERE